MVSWHNGLRGQRARIEAGLAWLKAAVDSAAWERVILTLIIINAVILGMETSPTLMAGLGPVIGGIDTVILAVFVVEILARMAVHRLDFWRDPWSVFDFLVVAIALVPATGNFSVLRALRIVRALRLIAVVPAMRRVVSGLIRAIPGMGAVILLLLLMLYVFSVIATQLYGAAAPELFGTLGSSAFTLFKVMTLEGWPDIADRVMASHPNAWLFFLVYILVTSFAVLNLVIGIIVDAMQSADEAEESARQATAKADADALLAEIRLLRGEVQALRRSAARERDAKLDFIEGQ